VGDGRTDLMDILAVDAITTEAADAVGVAASRSQGGSGRLYSTCASPVVPHLSTRHAGGRRGRPEMSGESRDSPATHSATSNIRRPCSAG
jgi:hypothetical protein